VRTYAIGDVHGRADLLDAALRRIERDAPQGQGRVICLGDYVDRGPDSRAVIERLMHGERTSDVTCLKGNHEALLVEAMRIRCSRTRHRWLANGGLQTLASYGGEDLDLVPLAHLRWLEGLPLIARDARRTFVHAGLRPGVPDIEQDSEAMLWIRERFLRAPASAFERHVVHGHTSTWSGKPKAASPERLAHRTNLDTAAWSTGVLSVGVFDESCEQPVDIWPISAA
jgi:serine/threonine protein phosphatase 1